MEKLNILGINVALAGKSQVLNLIEGFLAKDKKHFLVTPNPEILLQADKDEELFHILNQADLSVADGFGLKFAALAMGKNLKVYAGADLLGEILGMAGRRKIKVAVMNWDNSLSQNNDIAKALEKKYPGLDYEVLTAGRLSDNFPATDAEIIIANQGAPFQEKFIYHGLKSWPKVKIALGVGGAFDFLTGRIKRSPVFLRALGLEWLWRLICEPKKRFRRIVNAVIVFPAKFISWRFFQPFFYRENVVCLGFKKERGKFKVFLVERRDMPGHWQLPQGGKEGLPAAQAALKELKEEAGTNSFEIVRIFKNVYRYKFPKRDFFGKNYGQTSARHRGYKGQKQDLAIARFTGNDNEIRVNYWDHKAWKWVLADRLENEVHAVRRESAKIFLDKFYEITKGQ